jgi:hypothetical protein
MTSDFERTKHPESVWWIFPNWNLSIPRYFPISCWNCIEVEYPLRSVTNWSSRSCLNSHFCEISFKIEEINASWSSETCGLITKHFAGTLVASILFSRNHLKMSSRIEETETFSFSTTLRIIPVFDAA